MIAGTLPHRSHPVRSMLNFARAIHRARSLQPDLIYVYRPLDVPFGIAAGRLCGAPVVLHLCLPKPPTVPWLFRLALRRLALVISVSSSTARLWQSTGIRAESVQVVHTGIDTNHYVPAAAHERIATRRSLGLDPSAFFILYIGRLALVKGVDLLVEAFLKLSAEEPSARLVVVGGPSLAAEPEAARRYEEKLRVMGEPAGVLFLRHKKDVLPLIQSADLVVAPSRWQEPFSRSVIEPLACGVPVIATSVGGNPEILTGWLADYLVPPDDAASLTDRMQSLVGWRRSDPALAERCRQMVVDRLSLPREIDTIEEAFNHLLARRGSVAGN